MLGIRGDGAGRVHAEDHAGDDPAYQPLLSEQYVIDMGYGGNGGSVSSGGYNTWPLMYAGLTTTWTTTPGILSAAELAYTGSMRCQIGP